MDGNVLKRILQAREVDCFYAVPVLNFSGSMFGGADCSFWDAVF